MSKPNLPLWGVTGVKTEPPGAKKNSGFKAGFPEGAQFFNWVADLVWQWIRGFQGHYADIVVGSAGQVTSLDATHDVDDFVAAIANGDTVLFLDGTHTLGQSEDITEDDVTVIFEAEAILAASTFTMTFSGARSRVGPGRFTGFAAGEIIVSGADSSIDAIGLEENIIAASGGSQYRVTGNEKPQFMLNWISGLVSSNGSTPDDDVDISVGECRDDQDESNMVLSSALTKQLGPSAQQWVVGSGNGGLDGTESVAGTPDADTWYHIWLIRRSDTGVVDALLSESATAPMMPTDYDQKRHIGAVLTDATADILLFTATELAGGGLQFEHPVLIDEISNYTASTARQTKALDGVPPGRVVFAQLLVTYAGSSGGSQDAKAWVLPADFTDVAPTLGIAVVSCSWNGADEDRSSSLISCRTDTSNTVAHRQDNTTLGLTFKTLGYIDHRR